MITAWYLKVQMQAGSGELFPASLNYCIHDLIEDGKYSKTY